MRGFAIVVGLALLGLLMLWGWILNLLKLLQIVVDGSNIAATETVIRVIGAVLWPIGTVAGFM